METLAYLHCASAYEESSSTESVKTETKARLFEGLNWKKFSSRACLFLLPLVVGLGSFSVPAEAYARNLSYGKRGHDVVRLQRNLKYYGFFPYRVRATGYFGSITKRSVKNIQRACGVRADGIVGPQTRKYCL